MKYLILFIVFMLSTSCNRFILGRLGSFNQSPKILNLNYKDKTIVFMGMVHLAKKEYYENAKLMIDSFTKEGYVVYGEYVKFIGNYSNKPTKEDTIDLKKLRKIIGFDISTYLNNTKYLKLQKKYNLEVQHTSLYMKDSNDFANIVDVTTRQMVNEFEKNVSTINLDSCDLNTDLNKKYVCKKATYNDRVFLLKEVILNFRNRNIADVIMRSPNKKILVVYGSKHYEGLKTLLKD
jgi:hypothetical protein